MKHRSYLNKLTLLLYDELTEAEGTKLQRHLDTCRQCQKEWTSLRAMKDAVSRAGILVEDATVVSARNAVVRSLRVDEPRTSIADRIRELFGIAPNAGLRPVLAAGLLVVIALVIGLLLPRAETPVRSGISTAAYDPFGSNAAVDPQIINLRVVSQDQATGAIEFEFEAVMPVHVKGNVNDPGVQSVLARALVSSQNPGVRLRAASMISEPAVSGDPASRDLAKSSLISALLHDPNRGVRREALKALRSYMPDTAVTMALLTVLRTESNVAMRIAAINSLEPAKLTPGTGQAAVIAALQDKSESDENHYIRIRARAALQEVQQ